MLLKQDFRPDPIDPPLPRLIPALPLLLRSLTFDPPPGTPPWGMGYLFMNANREQYQQLFVLARCTAIVAAAGLAVLVFHWTRALYGWEAALVSLFLFSFSPSMLAHGHLVTTDLPGALGFTATMYSVWRWLDQPTLSRAITVGLALGIAIALKLSCLMLVLIIAIVTVLDTSSREAPTAALPGRRLAFLLGSAAAVSLVVINLAYGLDGIFTPLDEVGFREDGEFISLARWIPWLRLPLPVPFLQGLDLALIGDKPRQPTYFLGGEMSVHGWWYYHLVAYALKTPFPLLISAALALALWATGRFRGRREYCVFLPILFVFGVNSLLNPFDIGIRHVLAADPFIFIAASPVLAASVAVVWNGRRALRDCGRALVAIFALAWFATASLTIAPRYLQYFNEVAGGPRNGHRWLIDSNLDWGQDLIRLSEYLDQHHFDSINLAYFGRVDPTVYGIRFRPVEEGQSHGLTAVSASLLMGRPYLVWLSPSDRIWVKTGAYTWLQKFEPTARVGAMFLYDLP